MFPWNTSSKPDAKERPKPKRPGKPSRSGEAPPNRGPTNLFRGNPQSSPAKTSTRTVKERVRQIQTPPDVALRAEYNLRGGPKPRWIPPTQSFEPGENSANPSQDTESEESPNQSLDF
jgi:hypothetical protein